MTDFDTRTTGTRTLADRMSEGPIPVDDVLRYATLLGEALRKLHDNGKSHGAVSPQAILLTDDTLDLVPPPETAPKADTQADIFAFGTVLGEMLAGRADRDSADEHGLSALVASCLATDPADRLPGMKKALLELKLAGLATRHSGMWAAVRSDSEAAMRSEIERSEARQEARLKQHETLMAEKDRANGDALGSMRAEINAMQGKLTEFHQSVEVNTFRLADLESGVQTAIQQLGAKLAESVQKIEQDVAAQKEVLESMRRSMTQTDDLMWRMVQTVEARLAAAQRASEESTARIEIVEKSIQSAADQNTRFESSVSDGLRQVQTEMQAHTAVVESVRKSMAQTDDLVGRVVEAVESILDLGTMRA